MTGNNNPFSILGISSGIIGINIISIIGNQLLMLLMLSATLLDVIMSPHVHTTTLQPCVAVTSALSVCIKAGFHMIAPIAAIAGKNVQQSL